MARYMLPYYRCAWADDGPQLELGNRDCLARDVLNKYPRQLPSECDDVGIGVMEQRGAD